MQKRHPVVDRRARCEAVDERDEDDRRNKQKVNRYERRDETANRRRRNKCKMLAVEEVLQSKAHRLMLVLLCWTLGFGILLPFLPQIQTNFFASETVGRHVKCEDLTPDSEDLVRQACRDAHSESVYWSSMTSFFSQSVVSFLLNPMVGVWSDKYGRRPFLIAGICGAAMPIAVIYLHVQRGVSFYWFYPASVATSGISTISITLAYISDSISPPNRAPAFGLVLASFSLGILIGPIIGAFVSMAWGINLSLLAVLLSLLATYLFVPESFQQTEQDTRSPDLPGRKSEHLSCKIFSSIQGLSILCRSKLFAMLAACAMIAGICQEAIQDLLLQYLQIKFDFVSRDQGIVLGILGAGSLLVQSLILPLLLAAVGVKQLLVIGLAATMLQQFCMAFVAEKWQVYLTIAAGTIGSVSFPAISSIKANNANSSEQGTVQGALFGARALAQGIGPVMFAAIFSAFTRSDTDLPYFPGAPFLFGTLLMLVAVMIAAYIEIKPEPTSSDLEHAWEGWLPYFLSIPARISTKFSRNFQSLQDMGGNGSLMEEGGLLEDGSSAETQT